MTNYGHDGEIVVPAWTKGDFFSDEGAPYKWLYGFESDAYRMACAEYKLIEYAQGLGIKNPKAMIRRYAQGRMGIQMAARITEFTDQAMELDSGPYECTDAGIVREGRMGETIVACTHPIMPVARLVNVDTGAIRIRLAWSRGRGWRDAVFDKEVLSSARTIVQLAACGISVTSETAKELVRYLSTLEDRNYAALPEIRMTDRLGWVGEHGFSPYVDGLVYDSGGQFEEEFKAVRCGGSYEAWLDVAKEARANSPVSTRIVLAASFASVLLKKFDALPFVVHLWGSVSGIGKSVALILAGSVWAYPEIGYYIKSTKATDVALEQMAFFAGNMPLCLDELQLIQSRKNFDEMIYSLCEGTGKSRGAKTGGLQTVRRWCCAILTTGEQPIMTASSRAGAVNRVIEVECIEKTFADPRAAYQTMVRNYGWAGKKFVQALQEDGHYLELAREVQQRAYEQLRGKATDKQILTASIVLAADYLSDLILFGDGRCLTADDILPYLVSTESADVNRRAYEWLCDYIASNPLKFKPLDTGQYQGECWGKLEYDDKGEPVRALIIRSIFDRAMTDAGFNPASFLSWAAQACVIQRGEKLSLARRILPGGPLIRCVVLNLPQEEPEGCNGAFEPVQTELPF